MKRLLRTYTIVTSQQQQCRYYQFENSGKSLMGSPEEQPCPDAYTLGVNFDTYPEIYMGFHHIEIDPYIRQATNLYDNWEYKKYGDWWNIGSFGCNVLWAAFPLLFYLFTKFQHDNAIDAKSSGFIKYYHYAGFTPFAIHVHEEEPIAD